MEAVFGSKSVLREYLKKISHEIPLCRICLHFTRGKDYFRDSHKLGPFHFCHTIYSVTYQKVAWKRPKPMYKIASSLMLK